MNKIRIPAYLKSGDKVIIVSPSGNIDCKFVDGAEAWFKNRGLQTSVAKYAQAKRGRYCGTLEERLFDLQSAMDDPSVRLIFCSRGGYGVVQLLPQLNFGAVLHSPKWIVGYSDITALHLAFVHQGIASLHAPMAKHLSEEPFNDLASQYFADILFGKQVVYSLPNHPLNIRGRAMGHLVGGNLAVIAGLMGSCYTQVFKGAILFIEEIGERAYCIDRMIWNLKLAGVFDQISALIVGQFTDCEEELSMDAPIRESIKAIVEPYNIPVVFDFPVGHVKANYPLMEGGLYYLNVSDEKVKLCLEK